MHQDNEYPFPDISLDESSLNRSCSHPPAPFNQTSIDKPEKSQILKDTLKQTEKEYIDILHICTCAYNHGLQLFGL